MQDALKAHCIQYLVKQCAGYPHFKSSGYCQDFRILLQNREKKQIFTKVLLLGRLIKFPPRADPPRAEKNMYQDEEEKELEEHGFRISEDGDEPLDMPETIPDLGIDDDDPENRYT